MHVAFLHRLALASRSNAFSLLCKSAASHPIANKIDGGSDVYAAGF